MFYSHFRLPMSSSFEVSSKNVSVWLENSIVFVFCDNNNMFFPDSESCKWLDRWPVDLCDVNTSRGIVAVNLPSHLVRFWKVLELSFKWFDNNLINKCWAVLQESCFFGLFEEDNLFMVFNLFYNHFQRSGIFSMMPSWDPVAATCVEPTQTWVSNFKQNNDERTVSLFS